MLRAALCLPLLIASLEAITQSHELTVLCLGRLLPLSDSLVESLHGDVPEAPADLCDEVAATLPSCPTQPNLGAAAAAARAAGGRHYLAPPDHQPTLLRVCYRALALGRLGSTPSVAA